VRVHRDAVVRQRHLGVILPHLYTGGTVTFLHPYTPESWAAHIEADRSTLLGPGEEGEFTVQADI
jgi:hypothetical protein